MYKYIYIYVNVNVAVIVGWFRFFEQEIRYSNWNYEQQQADIFIQYK